MSTCDIIIPTYNNAKVVPLALTALSEQAIPLGWTARVIISDDGSTDATVRVAKRVSFSSVWQAPLYLENNHQGVAMARNRGLDVATADIICFLGADQILAPGSLASHLTFHDSYPDDSCGALGMVMWDPLVHPSVVMEWMTHGGPQNDFDSLLGKMWADSRHFFYASHISLKRNFIHKHRFSPDFKEYGWEDLDVGRKLASLGLQLGVLHNAISHHHHYYSWRAIQERQYALGQGIHIYQNHYPEEVIIPPPTTTLKLFKRYVATITPLRLLIWQGVKWAQKSNYSWPWLFQIATTMEFWYGFSAKKD